MMCVCGSSDQPLDRPVTKMLNFVRSGTFSTTSGKIATPVPEIVADGPDRLPATARNVHVEHARALELVIQDPAVFLVLDVDPRRGRHDVVPAGTLRDGRGDDQSQRKGRKQQAANRHNRNLKRYSTTEARSTRRQTTALS